MKLIEYIKGKRINKIINKYTKLFFKKIEDNKPILIEAFVKYYGNEYRNIITERINNTCVYTFVSDITIKRLKNLIEKNLINNASISNDIKKILKYYEKNHITARIYCNGEDVQDESVKKITAEYISNNKNNASGMNFTGMSNQNIQSSLIFVSICQFFLDETALIHEYNHAIRLSILAEYVNKNGDDILIKKRGIDTSNEDIKIEEIIQHKAALEIVNIFHSLNGCISMQPDIGLISNYEKLFPLIDNFYQKYKKLLKKASITDNMNAIFSEIDKEKYEEYKRIIREQFHIVYDNNNLSAEVIEYANSLVNQMDKKENTKENIYEYIKELEASGKTVRFLSNDGNENQYGIPRRTK